MAATPQQQSPLISVVIPTYNHGHFLKQALQSVLDQTCQDWEALVIDNHSHDDTDNVVASFQDSRIRLLKIHNHGVIAASRNFGIREARGKWVAFLDSDDFWYPNKLDECLKRLGDGYDLVCHAERWQGDGQDRKVFYGPEAAAAYTSLLFEGNCISTSAVMVSNESLKSVEGFSEALEIVTAEDYDLWLRLAHHGIRMGFVQKVLGEYRIHAGSQSRAILRNMQAVKCVVQTHLANLSPLTWIDRVRARRRMAIVYYGGARGLQDMRQFSEALPLFVQAMYIWPFLPKLYIAMILNSLHRRIS